MENGDLIPVVLLANKVSRERVYIYKCRYTLYPLTSSQNDIRTDSVLTFSNVDPMCVCVNVCVCDQLFF